MKNTKPDLLQNVKMIAEAYFPHLLYNPFTINHSFHFVQFIFIIEDT